jgi:uncharacterized protein YjiS (DUF1127 family)
MLMTRQTGLAELSDFPILHDAFAMAAKIRNFRDKIEQERRLPDELVRDRDAAKIRDGWTAIAWPRAAEVALVGDGRVKMNLPSHADRALPVQLSSPGSWLGVLLKLIEQLTCKLATRNGIAELRAMDDRRLTDIGLTRQQIEYVARHGRWPIVRQSSL